MPYEHNSAGGPDNRDNRDNRDSRDSRDSRDNRDNRDSRDNRDRRGGPGGRNKKKSFHRRKVCRFCADHIKTVDYKDVKTLRIFITERGKIVPRRISGNCAKHQRLLTKTVLRARFMALLPYTAMVPSAQY